MSNIEYKVLLIEPSKELNTELTSGLIELDFRVISVKNIESAMKRLLENNPDIIICQKDLSDYSGFQFYSMLNNDLLKNEIPFILLMHEFSKEDLLVGMELGIDGFLFPPFDSIKINNIILKQLQKSRKRKKVASTQFQSLFEVTPFGIFEARDNTIVKANKSFYNLIYKSDKVNTPAMISGIFDFCTEKSNELKLLRCLNGITRYSHFKGVPSRLNSNETYDIYLSFVENGMSSAKIIGLVIPTGDSWNLDTKKATGLPANNNPIIDTKLKPIKQIQEINNFFTSREKQILKLSAKGAPVKQIANQLGISERTVEKHRSNIIRKTNSGNITEAVFYANNKNLLEFVSN